MGDTIAVPGSGEPLGFDTVTLPDGTANAKVARIKYGYGADGTYTEMAEKPSSEATLALLKAATGGVTDTPAAIAAATSGATAASTNALLRLIAALLNTAPDSSATIGKVAQDATVPWTFTSNAPTVLYAKIDAATVGANLLVAAATGKIIRVVGFALVSAAANTVTMQSGSTALTGAMSFAANGGVSAPQSTAGLFQTTAGAALNMSLGSAGQVSGWLVYQLV